MTKANFGVVGMAVMGRNLALNIESRGYTVAIYNRSANKTERCDCDLILKKTLSEFRCGKFCEFY